jgi:hypothetical protein
MAWDACSNSPTGWPRSSPARGQASSAADIDATLREIRIALLERDVALPVVREFTARVGTRLGRGVEALNPAQRSSRSSTRNSSPSSAAGTRPFRQESADRDHAGGPAGLG